MKKMYLKPETIWMNIEIQQMVCESLGKGGSTNDENDILSRESYSDWDD